MCAEVPRLDLRTKIALVIHHRELSRSSNTGLLAHQSLVNSEVRIRGESRETLDLSGLLSPEISVVIVLSERRCAGTGPGTGLPGFAADPADRAGWHLATGSKDSFPPPRAKKYSESEDQRAEPRNFSTAGSKPAGKDGDLASHRVRAANHRRRSRGGSAHEALPRQGRSNPKSARPSMDKRLAGRNRGSSIIKQTYRPERSVPARGSQRPGETDAAKRLQLPEFLTGSTAAGFGSVRLFRALQKRLPVPLEVGVGVRLRRHQRSQAPLRQFAFEFLAHPFIFVDVFDLIFGAVFDFFGVAEKLPRRMERQITRRFAPGVEVLVKPFIWRREATRFVPGHDDFVFSFLPHDRVTLAGGNDDLATRAVAVRFFI